ncbi:MAG TPA: hypothetical protein VFS43_35000 [Polyangiaceae bacterium]|nr:hypothetical protein [Polyangiaceae bacterium]
MGPLAFAQQGAGGRGGPAPAASGAAARAGATATAAGAATAGTAAGASFGGGAQPAAATFGAGAAPAGSAGGATAMDGQTYVVRLRDLEQRVDELKEQIRRSHTRLSLLSDTVLSGGVGGSRADIQFQNEMSSAFRLIRALFVLDGAVQYNKADDTGALSDQPTIPIFAGSIPPGDHTVQVLLQLQGNGYGVFSYLKGYKFEVRSTHSFTATEGKTMTLQVIGYEKGGVTTPLEERPAIRFFEKVTTGIQGPLPGVPQGPAAPGAPAAPAATGGGSASGGAAAGAASAGAGFSIGAGAGGKKAP